MASAGYDLDKVLNILLPHPGEGREWRVETLHQFEYDAIRAHITLLNRRTNSALYVTFMIANESLEKDYELLVMLLRSRVNDVVKQLVNRILEEEYNVQPETKRTEDQQASLC